LGVRLIAEFCQNHNGDFDILQRMIDAAAEGGATHGKIQTIFADDLSFRPEFETGETDANGRTVIIKRPYKAEYERLKTLELTYDQQRRFVEQCHGAGLEPLTTAFNLSCIPFIRNLGWRSIKVASYDCGSLPLIRALAGSFDELIISTGATFDDEILKTSEMLNELRKPFTFLHCVTLYPTPLDQMNLSRMDYLRQFTASVGLSDHSLVERDGVKAALAAIYLGAEVIERHFTVLPSDQTRDGRVSIRKEHLKVIRFFSALNKSEQQQYLSEHVPEFSVMNGTPVRDLSQEEMLNRAYYRGRFANKLERRQIFNWERDAESLPRYG
jgi:N,N'-diacetyllegionaminate synthase